jgi:2-oxo-4-hydroxy-4-carboxy-5-ureidoimidazoline decarboxylase
MAGERWTLDELNRCDPAVFTTALGGLFEGSAWVAERTAAQRPFASTTALHAALCATMHAALDKQKLALIRAHPDLAGRLARSEQLSPESACEQAGAGLDDLNPAEATGLRELNAAYHKRFGFPFILCARLNTHSTILAALRSRLGHDPAAEVAAALAEIEKIARLRLHDLLGSE